MVADSIAMPVHWYYNQSAIERDFGKLDSYHQPKKLHPDSILGDPNTSRLMQMATFYASKHNTGETGCPLHQFLKAGENTLNSLLAIELFELIRRSGHYDATRWLDHYVSFMLTPEKHNDTYVEEYHRHFFTNYASGRKPINCGVRDIHIGGLVAVPAIIAAIGPRHPDIREIVQTHVSLTHKDQRCLVLLMFWCEY